MDVLASIDPKLCVRCKAARALCGIQPCPLLAKVKSYLPPPVKDKHLFGSSPPSLFVGRHGYPNVSVGPMLPTQHLEEDAARHLDDPASWLDNMTIPDVVGLRSSLVRTKHTVSVKRIASQPDRITNLSQELAMSARPVDTEVLLDRAPRFQTNHVADFTTPHGPTAIVERATLTENVRVERPIERLVADTDVRANQAIAELGTAGVEGYQIERLLSAGLLGQENKRKLVPTRWAITATDDMQGNAIRDKIRDLPTINKPTIHFAEHFGNRFHVLLLPRVWGFELIEAWLKGAFWSLPGNDVIPAVDWEDHTGRSSYAANTTGGYYATRLPVLEHMQSTGRQATAIVLREITEDYTTPLGVWVVRETMRRAMQSKGLEFEDTAMALRHMQRRARWKNWESHANFFVAIKHQRTLESF